ncbi:LysR family transcriptional regulator [Camelimonas lactis]|uniref:Uncharacterized protein n=1 Tax=Camelimonas lactis TaxID=659006 RepID=A0A4R2GW25_9HYPH|nr:LysR family transcriptional regulator [Camelimonas lactis]TCO15210.1 hypothetical protein EV666_102188 [Camelimonas lactis]
MMAYPQLDDAAMAILQQAISEAGSIAAVARRLGYKRPSISLVLARKYPGDTRRLRAQIVEAFGGQQHCPFLGSDIAASACRDFRTRPLPTSRRAEARHWQACRQCQFNPERRKHDDGAF